MNKFFTQERLIKLLIIVSILTVTVIGIKTLGELSEGFFATLSMAIRSVMIPFALAFLLSFILGPLAKLIENKTPLNRTLSIIAAISVGVLFIVAIVSITVAFIISQMTIVIIRLIDYVDNEAFRGFLEMVFAWLQESVYIDSIEEAFEDFEQYGVTLDVVFGWLGAVFAGLISVTSSIIRVIFTIILTPVFMYYLIKDRTQIFEGLIGLFPSKSQPHAKALGLKSDEVIRGYFIGHGIVMIFITIFFMITYTILSLFIPGFTVFHAVLFALVMGLFSIIPYLGVWISMAMPIVMFLTLHFEASNPGSIYIIGIMMIFVLNIIEEILESTLVQPNVFSRQVRIHPLAVLSSFLFFGALFGLAGFILAVPIAGTIKVTIHYFKELNQDKPDKKTEQ